MNRIPYVGYEGPRQRHYVPPQAVLLNLNSFPSPRFLIAYAAAHGGVTPEDIFGRSQKYPVVCARHHAIRLIDKHCHRTNISAIARLLGLNHTTVSHALGRLKRKPTT